MYSLPIDCKSELEMPYRTLTEDVKDSITICLPGLNGGGMELGQLPSFLKSNGFDTIIPEIEGYLYGTPADSYELWIGAVHNTIDNLRGQYKTINLAGISMGATLALAVASQRIDISSIALLSPSFVMTVGQFLGIVLFSILHMPLVFAIGHILRESLLVLKILIYAGG